MFIVKNPVSVHGKSGLCFNILYVSHHGLTDYLCTGM